MKYIKNNNVIEAEMTLAKLKDSSTNDILTVPFYTVEIESKDDADDVLKSEVFNNNMFYSLERYENANNEKNIFYIICKYVKFKTTDKNIANYIKNEILSTKKFEKFGSTISLYAHYSTYELAELTKKESYLLVNKETIKSECEKCSLFSADVTSTDDNKAKNAFCFSTEYSNYTFNDEMFLDQCAQCQLLSKKSSNNLKSLLEFLRFYEFIASYNVKNNCKKLTNAIKKEINKIKKTEPNSDIYHYIVNKNYDEFVLCDVRDSNLTKITNKNLDGSDYAKLINCLKINNNFITIYSAYFEEFFNYKIFLLPNIEYSIIRNKKDRFVITFKLESKKFSLMPLSCNEVKELSSLLEKLLPEAKEASDAFVSKLLLI